MHSTRTYALSITATEQRKQQAIFNIPTQEEESKKDILTIESRRETESESVDPKYMHVVFMLCSKVN